MSNNNPTQLEKLKARLYAELNSASTESDEFKAAFRYIQELEEKESDPELEALEKDNLKLKNEKERLEVEKLAKPEEKESFWSKNMNVLIPAVATFAGVVVIVGAEVFGPAILNSKALTRLPKP